jgi:alkanesulfonate monooxygenase SsuD/methylene tetrahydromethanopterin reductase-like flavin-dependent oxidoreductase (luciferase family)
MTVHPDMGLHTFGDVTADANGALLPHAVVIRNLIEQAAPADELGIDFIGVGEHHRADFAVSAPEIVLAAIASRTKRIRLGSCGTLRSPLDARHHRRRSEAVLAEHRSAFPRLPDT